MNYFCFRFDKRFHNNTCGIKHFKPKNIQYLSIKHYKYYYEIVPRHIFKNRKPNYYSTLSCDL